MYRIIYPNYVDFISRMKDSFKYFKMSKHIDILGKVGSQWEKRSYRYKIGEAKNPVVLDLNYKYEPNFLKIKLCMS